MTSSWSKAALLVILGDELAAEGWAG